jgi:hypothetical protein
MKITTWARHGARPERSPFSLERDFKAEMAYIVLSIGVWIGLVVTDRWLAAVAWFMATLFMFGIWRIGRARFQ